MSLLLKALAQVDSRPLAPLPKPIEARAAPPDPPRPSPSSVEPKFLEPATTTMTASAATTAAPLVTIAIPPPPDFRQESAIAAALGRLDELRDLLARVDTETVEVPPPSAVVPEPVVPPAAPQLPEPVISLAPSPIARQSITVRLAEPQPALAPPLRFRTELREFRDHLLSRGPLTKPATLVCVDAGRRVQDATWILSFAASLLQAHAASNVLVVEAAGVPCGIASSLGLDASLGLSDVLSGTAKLSAAIQPTGQAQIQLLTIGAKPLHTSQQPALDKLWPELKQQFDVILVAAGPLDVASAASGSNPSAAPLFLPLAQGAILSVELDGTPQLVAAQSKHLLVARGINLLGCLVRSTQKC